MQTHITEISPITVYFPTIYFWFQQTWLKFSRFSSIVQFFSHYFWNLSIISYPTFPHKHFTLLTIFTMPPAPRSRYFQASRAQLIGSSSLVSSCSPLLLLVDTTSYIYHYPPVQISYLFPFIVFYSYSTPSHFMPLYPVPTPFGGSHFNNILNSCHCV